MTDILQAPRTAVRLDRGVDAFAGLNPDARLRLMVRILCELVAYGELTDEVGSAPRTGEAVAAGG